MNHIHMSAMVTHMAQLAQRPPSRPSADTAEAHSTAMQHAAMPMQQDMERVLSSMGASTSAPSSQQTVPQRRVIAKVQPAQQQRPAHHLVRPVGAPGSAAMRLPVSQTSQQPASNAPATRLLDALLQDMLGVMHRLQPRQLANCLWALAKLGHAPSAQWLSRCLASVARQLDGFEPQHLSNTAYALALRPEWLEQVQGRSQLVEKLFAAAQGKLSAFKPQELANLLYAAAQMHSTRPLNPGSACARCVFVAAQAARARASELRSQEVANIVWAVAVLSGKPGLVGQGQEQPLPSQVSGQARGTPGARGRGPHGTPPGQHLAQQVHGSRTAQPLMPVPSSAWLIVMLRRLEATHKDMAASGLAAVLLSLGWLGARPRRTWVRGLLQGALPLLSIASPSELCSMSLGLAYMGYKPAPEWAAVWWSSFASQLPTMRPQSLANGCWAMGRLRQQPTAHVAARLLVAAAQRMDAFSAGDLAQLLPALAAFGCRPDTAWLELLCGASYDVVGAMGSREVTVLLCALARHNHRPPRAWVLRMLQHTYALLPCMPGNALAMVLRSLAVLGLPLPRAWVGACLAAASNRMGELGARDVANMLWALAALDIRPSTAWMRAAVGHARALLHAQHQQAALEAGGQHVHQVWCSEVTKEPVCQERIAGEQLRAMAARGGRVRDRNRLAQQLATWDAVSLTQCIWALGRMGFGPGHEFMTAFSQSLDRMVGSGGLGAATEGSVITTTTTTTKTSRANGSVTVQHTAGGTSAHSMQVDSMGAAAAEARLPPASTTLAASLMNRRPSAWLQQHCTGSGAATGVVTATAARARQSVSEDGRSAAAAEGANSSSSSNIALLVLQGVAQWAAARLGYAPLAQAAAGAPGTHGRREAV